MINTLDTIVVDKNKLWTKYYFMIVIFNLFVSIVHFMMVSMIPLYAKQIGGSNSTAGLIMGVFTISALLFRPVFGSILDSKGRKIVLLIGISLFLAGTFFQSFAASIVVLFLLRIVQGIGFSANTTAGGTIVADLVPATRLSEGIGNYGIATTLATAIGPALGLQILGKSNYFILFICAALVLCIGLLIAIFLNYEKRDLKVANIEKPINKKIAGQNKNYLSNFNFFGAVEKSLIPVGFMVLIVALAFASVLTFLPIYALSKGIGNVGLFYIVYAITILCTRVFIGRLADRIGITPVILPSITIMALALAVLAFVNTLPMFLVVAVLLGLGFGTTQPLLNSLILNLSPVEKRGVANAFYYSAMDIGMAIGSIFWGIISQWLGFTCVYLSSTVGMVICGIAYILYIYKNKTVSITAE